jgi:hypothetical protein
VFRLFDPGLIRDINGLLARCDGFK